MKKISFFLPRTKNLHKLSIRYFNIHLYENHSEATDVDLSFPTNYEKLKEITMEKGILVIRNQNLTDKEMLRFAKNFGEPIKHR